MSNKLWTVYEHDYGKYLLLEGESLIRTFRSRDRAQEIADDHNAWVILEEREFIVQKDLNGKWTVYHSASDGISWTEYPCESHDTPRKAVLAAGRWLSEMEGAKQLY